MGRLMIFLSGAGIAIFGGASYFAGIPLPIDCKSIICTISTTPITLDMLFMGIGALLVLLSMLVGKATSKN